MLHSIRFFYPESSIADLASLRIRQYDIDVSYLLVCLPRGGGASLDRMGSSMGKSRIALVTGASKGIGTAIAIALAREGFDIWLNYKSSKLLAGQIRQKVEEIGVKCRMLRFDVSNPNEVQATLEPLLEKDTPYASINNDGITKDALMVFMNRDDWKDVLGVTLDGFY